MLALLFFFFQAEDGIRDYKVTGVQTCALPILIVVTPCTFSPESLSGCATFVPQTIPTLRDMKRLSLVLVLLATEIGRASCRARVWTTAGGVPLIKMP